MPPHQPSSNLARLEAEDVGNSAHLNAHERALIETLTADEVELLIQIRKKLGHARPDAPESRMLFPF